MYKNVFFDRKKGTMHLWDDHNGYKSFKYKPYCYMEDEHGEYTSMFGDKLSKKHFNSTRDLWAFRNNWKTFEADVRPEIRTLIDTYYESEIYIPKVNTAFVDIEIKVRQADGFPDAKDAKFPVNAITLYTTRDDTYRTYILKLNKNQIIDFDVSKEGDNVEVKFFNTESELLETFAHEFGSLDINLYGGWNSGGFDVPYLFNRIRSRCGPHILNYLSKISIAEIDTDRDSYRIAGTDHLCYLELYEKFQMAEKPSYKLDSVAEDELDEKKIPYEGFIGDLYFDDFNKFVSYNIHDVRLIVRLDNKLKYYDVARMLCHRGNVPYSESLFTTVPIDGSILTYLKRNKLVAPNKPQAASHESYTGAFISPPVVGLHEYVVEFDIRSEYPSILSTLNISPETKLGAFSSREEALAEYPNDTISPNNVVYSASRRGVIPKIVDIWFDERVAFNNSLLEAELELAEVEKRIAELESKQSGIAELLERKKGLKSKIDQLDIKQGATKTALNSIYGALALPSYRFYDIDNALAVTSGGQAVIKAARDAVNGTMDKLGADSQVLYVSTDAVLFSVDKLLNMMGLDLDDEKKCCATTLSDITPVFDKAINRAFNTLVTEGFNVKSGEHKLYMKIEWIARRLFLVAKNRYGMWLINEKGVTKDTIKFVGMDVKRKAFAKYYREGCIDIYTQILHGDDEKSIQESITALIYGAKDASISDISSVTGCKKVRDLSVSPLPIFERAALVHNEAIKDHNIANTVPIVGGSKLKWLYLKKHNPFNDKVIAFTEESPKQLLDMITPYIDFDTMNDKGIDGKVRPVMEACCMQMPEKLNEVFTDFFNFEE